MIIYTLVILPRPDGRHTGPLHVVGRQKPGSHWALCGVRAGRRHVVVPVEPTTFIVDDRPDPSITCAKCRTILRRQIEPSPVSTAGWDPGAA